MNIAYIIIIHRHLHYHRNRYAWQDKRSDRPTDMRRESLNVSIGPDELYIS